jgi:hypothetical protein
MAVPCFVEAAPLLRFLLIVFMALPFLAGAALVLVPPIAGYRARLLYLLTWCGTRPVKRRPRSFDVGALRQLLAATTVLTAALAGVIAATDHDLPAPVRWFAGGVAALAFGEMLSASLPLISAALGVMVPPLFQSPYRAATVNEFWAQRWNIGASELFRTSCFAPLARRSTELAMVSAFAASAIAHVLLAYFALGRWGISLACGAFFMVQPLPIAVERRLNVRHWRPIARHAWTLGALTTTSPLFVEPVLQIIERTWGEQHNPLQPSLAALGIVLVFTSVVALASLAALPPASTIAADEKLGVPSPDGK